MNENERYIYYNNGKVNRKFHSYDIILEGFVKGVLPIKDWVKVKISEAKKGHKVTQEQKDKQSSTLKTRYKTGEIVPYNKGKHLKESTRLKLSEINRNRKYSKEVCIKKSASMKGKNKDKFIELNLHWTHGGKPYDPDDKECQEKLKIWQDKAKTSQFYKNAIETWTIRDVDKLAMAKRNNLKYEVIYNV